MTAVRDFAKRFLVYAAVSALGVAVVFFYKDLSFETREGWNWRVLGPGAGAAVALGGAALLSLDRLRPYLTRLRVLTALNVALQCTLVAVVGILANLLAARSYRVIDTTFRGASAIGDRTRATVMSLPRRVRIHAIVRPDAEGGTSPALVDVRGLLDTLRSVAPGKIEVEYLDPDRDAVKDRVRALGLERGDLPSSEVIVFEAVGFDPRTPHVKVVDLDDLYDHYYFHDRDLAPRRTNFRGEDVVAQALRDVARERPSVVYFLSGQQELDARGAEGDLRIGALRGALEKLDYDVRPFRVARDVPSTVSGTGMRASSGASIPGDCDVLIIAGPRVPFDDAALAALRSYLDGGGRLLAMMLPEPRRNPVKGGAQLVDTRINSLIEPFGVRFGATLVHDPSQMDADYPLPFWFSAVVDTEHPVARSLAGLPIPFRGPQSLEFSADPPVDVHLAPILETTGNAVSVRDIEAVIAGKKTPEDASERRGREWLAAAIAREAPSTSTGTARESRLVLVGDVFFATDQALERQSFGPLNLALKSVAWLADRTEEIEYTARAPQVLHIELRGNDGRRLQFLALFMVPIACAGLGLLFVLGRR